jgi:hypothetical protein
MQTKSSLLNGGRKRTREVCLGQQVLSFKLRPMKKQVNRMTFHHGEDIYQVMLIHGTFMTERAQLLVSNQALHADYLTIYLRGGTIPVRHQTQKRNPVSDPFLFFFCRDGSGTGVFYMLRTWCSTTLNTKRASRPKR